MGHLSSPPITLWVIPSSVPLHRPQHLVTCIKFPEQMKGARIDATLLKIQPHWKEPMVDKRFLKIIRSEEFFSGHCDKWALNAKHRNSLKESSKCLINRSPPIVCFSHLLRDLASHYPPDNFLFRRYLQDWPSLQKREKGGKTWSPTTCPDKSTFPYNNWICYSKELMRNEWKQLSHFNSSSKNLKLEFVCLCPFHFSPEGRYINLVVCTFESIYHCC